jgi:hypothetical protein
MSTVEFSPRLKIPVVLSKIALLVNRVAVTLSIVPAAAVPQLVFASGVLALVPNAPLATPQTLSLIRLSRNVATVLVTVLLPGALITPTPLS